MGANMGPIWDRKDPGGPHVGPMNFVNWDVFHYCSILKQPAGSREPVAAYPAQPSDTLLSDG